MSDQTYRRRAAAMARTKAPAMPAAIARPIRHEAAGDRSKRLWAAAWKKINAERSHSNTISAAAPNPAKVDMWRRALRRRD